MIDLESATQTLGGTWFDRLVALLIGLVALFAATQAAVQVTVSGQEARALMTAARLISQIDARNASTSELLRLQLQGAQRGAHLGTIGGTRGIGAITSGDVLSTAIADAELAAAQRIIEISLRLGRPPDEGGPVDRYARELLAASMTDIQALADEQAAQADRAEVAGNRGVMAVLGLSLAALAGVLAGLAGILGDSRAGRLTLLSGYLAGGLVLAALLGSLR